MPGYGARYWAERTPAARRTTFPSFRGDAEADVVVIGGGLVGATAAYVLARGGLEVVLLEAERVASGSTSGGLGAILPEPDAWFRDVQTAAGLRVARTAWQDARRSALDFAAALRRIRARCDLAATDELIAPGGGGDRLRREQLDRKAARLEASWLTANVARSELGTPVVGAVRLHGGFVFDPVRATLALLRAAGSAGARIHEKSAVRRTRFTRRYADVFTASGRIRTNGVFVATGRPGPVFSQLTRHVRERQGFAAVTEPLVAVMRRETGARNGVIREGGPDAHWTRWLPDDRILFAGAASAPVGSRQLDRALVQRTAQLMYELSVRYPVISGLPARWGWSIPVVSTADGLPWIGPHRNYPFHFFALAFGWHADGLAWHAARTALRFFTGEQRKEDEAFGFLR